MALQRLSVFLLCLGLATFSAAQDPYIKVRIDPTYRTVPPPNDDFPQDPNHIWVVQCILLPISLICVLLSLLESKRWGSTVPTALTIGSASFVSIEAVNCFLGNVYWSTSHDPEKLMFTLLGSDFDIYVGIIWWSYGAVLSCGILAALNRNIQTCWLWALLGFAAFLDILLEECMLIYGGIYIYYGHQPLVFNTFPCWWAFCNVSSIFLGISIAYRYSHLLQGWKSLLVPPILPICYVGPQVLAGLPTMYAVQADYSPLVTQLCGVASCVVAVIQVAVIMDTVLERNPADVSQVGPSRQSKSAHRKIQ